MQGSLRQRGERSWELRVHAGREPQTALARFVTDVTEGVHATKKSGTVGELIEQWFSHNESDWSPTVVTSYRSIIDRHLLPRFGSTPLRQLTTADIDLLYVQLRKRGGLEDRPLAPATVKRVHAVLQRALAQAVKWGHLTINPAANASPPREPHHEVTPPDPDDVARLIAHADGDNRPLGCFLRLAATSGARRGELCALRWKQSATGASGDQSDEHVRAAGRAQDAPTRCSHLRWADRLLRGSGPLSSARQ
ncbi:MAG: hypothetical protein SGJ13_13740 [Actinomycetota bacterium]|nr:hypothetical protein [Actinomycetota bacterium]